MKRPGELIPAKYHYVHGVHVVYRCYDASGNLLYIGVSRCVHTRLKGHRHTSPWYSDVDRVEIETHDTSRSAHEAEYRAIWRERPQHNVMGQWWYDHGSNLRRAAA